MILFVTGISVWWRWYFSTWMWWVCLMVYYFFFVNDGMWLFLYVGGVFWSRCFNFPFSFQEILFFAKRDDYLFFRDGVYGVRSFSLIRWVDDSFNICSVFLNFWESFLFLHLLVKLFVSGWCVWCESLLFCDWWDYLFPDGVYGVRGFFSSCLEDFFFLFSPSVSFLHHWISIF